MQKATIKMIRSRRNLFYKRQQLSGLLSLIKTKQNPWSEGREWEKAYTYIRRVEREKM